MIRFLKGMGVAAIASLAFSSCLKDNDGHIYGEEAFGVVSARQGAFSIVTDRGNTLNIRENGDPAFDLKDDLRVVVNFSVLEQKAEDIYDVRVNAIGKVLTKDPVRLSRLTEEERKEIGQDPIEVWEAWFGGNYLNLNFMMYRNDPELAHFINLVVDEERSTEDEVIVTFRHNAFGDGRNMKAYGCVSFDLTELVPPGKNDVKITLEWTNYGGVTRKESGVFRLKSDLSPQTLAGAGGNKPMSASAMIR